MDEGGENTSLQLSVTASLVYIVVLLIVSSYVWIIVTVARTPSLHTASNCFLASLAVSLVITGLLGVPSVIWFTAIQILNSSSIFTMSWLISFFVIGFFLNAILLAADKWLKITRPFLYVRVVTRNKCTICLSVIWATTLLGSLIIAIVHTVTVVSYTEREIVYNSFALLAVVFGYGIIMPSVIVITLLNIGIHRIARQQARAIFPAVQQQQPRVENAAVAWHQPLPPFAIQQQGIHTKSTRQFSIFLLSFPVALSPMAPLLHLFYVTRIAEDMAVVVVLMIYCAAAFFQFAFCTLILTLFQRDYRQILKRNVRTVLVKMHFIGRR